MKFLIPILLALTLSGCLMPYTLGGNLLTRDWESKDASEKCNQYHPEKLC